MDTRTGVLAVAALLLVTYSSGCSEAEECPDDAACAPALSVPDVEHKELRSAYRELIGTGFSVTFALPSRNDMYYEYAADRTRKGRMTMIHPEPWVGDINPEPGTEVEEGAEIRITEIECPNQAPSCD